MKSESNNVITSRSGVFHLPQISHERYYLGAILLVSLAVQLLFSPYQGIYGDLQTYLSWGAQFDAHPLAFYSLTNANYPPLTIYTYGVVDLLYYIVGHLLGFSNVQLTILPSTRFALLWSIAKLPIIAANVGSSWLIYRIARRAATGKWALAAGLAYAISPCLMLDGAIWGQTDGVPIFFLLLAILAIQSQRPIQVGTLLALAIMIKPQPAIFVPILLCYLLLTSGWRALVKACVAALLVVTLICLPFLLPPHPDILAYFQNTTSVFSAYSNYGLNRSLNALNLWYLIDSYVVRASLTYQSPVIGSLTANNAGLILFAPIYALALFLIVRYRSIEAAVMAMALAEVGFFGVTELQGARYLFEGLAFLLLASVYHRSFAVHFAVASVTVLVNMLAVWAIAATFVENDALFSPLYRFFDDNPAIVVCIAILNLQLLVGVTISCVSWIHGMRFNNQAIVKLARKDQPVGQRGDIAQQGSCEIIVAEHQPSGVPGESV